MLIVSDRDLRKNQIRFAEITAASNDPPSHNQPSVHAISSSGTAYLLGRGAVSEIRVPLPGAEFMDSLPLTNSARSYILIMPRLPRSS